MKCIHISDSLSTNLRAGLASGTALEIEDSPLGRGAFGVVYRAIALDGKALRGQVVKVLTNKLNGSDQRGFETIRALQQKLDAENRRMRQQGTTLLDSHPALFAVPQLSFRGQLDGESIVGYTANDLTAFGMEDFGPFLEDDSKVRRLQALPLDSRLELARQLVSAFDLLKSVNYLHADFKPEALYIDIQKPTCAIIDFDSGAVIAGSGDQPTTVGTKQAWLAPEVLKQLDRSGKPGRIQITAASDSWSVTMAVHYLLFGCHPLFFLTEVSDRSMAEYRKFFRWPDVDSRCSYFNAALKKTYTKYADYLRTNLPQLHALFGSTLDLGYEEPSLRTSYGAWIGALAVNSRPEILSFGADRVLVQDSKPVRLAWNVRGRGRIELRGIADVTERAYYDVHVRRDSQFHLVFTPHSGSPVQCTVQVRVSREAPVIHAFFCDRPVVIDSKPLILNWRVTGAERITIDNGIGDVTQCSSYQTVVRNGTFFTMTAISQFGVVSVSTLQVSVSRRMPKIDFFRASKPLLHDSRQVMLSWKVSSDAARVTITGIGPVPTTGELIVTPSSDSSYHLIATSAFGLSTFAHACPAISRESHGPRPFKQTPFWQRWLGR